MNVGGQPNLAMIFQSPSRLTVPKVFMRSTKIMSCKVAMSTGPNVRTSDPGLKFGSNLSHPKVRLETKMSNI